MSLSRSLLTCSILLHLVPALAAAQAPNSFPVLDHVQGTLIQTAAAPVRPVLVDSAGEVWAVNTGQNTVERFGSITQQPLPSAPIDVRQVPWGPVSIAEWTPSDGGSAELLIVCRNTWGLLRMNKAGGGFKEWISLPAEPSDIVVDAAADRAFVSCTGADAVVQINLLVRDGKFHKRYDENTTRGATEILGDLQIKSPYFLHLMPDGKVRVAPLHSGNNTTVTNQMFENRDHVVKLDSASDPRLNKLPDKDLFEIDPAASLLDAVRPVQTAVGTILFAHGRNPVSGDYWMLNTEADNANPNKQSEPALKGDFLVNRVTLLGTLRVDVACDGASPFTPDTSIGQPFALAFHSSGNAFVAGLLTNNVTLFDPNGSRKQEIDLPFGSIPRGLAIAPATPELLAVYCWGTGRIEVYSTDHGNPTVLSTHVGGYALSNDPLTADQKEGRRLFFDGTISNPARKNLSCASCHVDGGTDFLAWNLSGMPFDDKGPMVTQTLIGLERVAPFHWRGERTLEDFNEFAFEGLLGAPDELSATEFAQLKSWLFSLRNPANPFQHRDRVIANGFSTQFIAPTQTQEFRSDIRALGDAVDAAGQQHQLITGQLLPRLATSSEAIEGLDHFSEDLVFQGRWRCTQCHSFPVGTNNDVTDDEGQNDPLLPERMHFKNTPFHEIWRKKQSLVVADTQEIGAAQFIDVRTFLGAGVQHAGGVPDVMRFAQAAAGGLNTTFPPRVAALMQQWDQGLAPAAHFAYWLKAGPIDPDAEAELKTYLLGQASKSLRDFSPTGVPVPNCDIAVIQYSVGLRKTWFLNRSLVPGNQIGVNLAAFSSDNSSEANRSMNWFFQQASNVTIPPTPQPSFLFIGLPVGMAERFAADFDMDGKRNRNDVGTQYTINPDPDTTAPVISTPRFGALATDQTTFFDASTNNVRLYVETNEPTTLTVTYDESPGVGQKTVTSPYLSRVHSLILNDLRPSTQTPSPADPQVTGEDVDYTITINANDASGNPALPVTTTLGSTADFSMPFNLIDPPDPSVSPVIQLQHEHVLTDPPIVTVGTLGGLGNRLVTVDLAATLKQGAAHLAAQNRVFAVRVYRQRGTDPALRLDVGAGLVNTLVDTRYVQNLLVRDAGNETHTLAGTGTLVVNTTAASSTQLRFRVAGSFVLPGDKVLVQVEAVVESTQPTVVTTGCSGNSCQTAEVSTANETALSQWDFPRTREENMQGSGTAPSP